MCNVVPDLTAPSRGGWGSQVNHQRVRHHHGRVNWRQRCATAPKDAVQTHHACVHQVAHRDPAIKHITAMAEIDLQRLAHLLVIVWRVNRGQVFAVVGTHTWANSCIECATATPWIGAVLDTSI